MSNSKISKKFNLYVRNRSVSLKIDFGRVASNYGTIKENFKKRAKSLTRHKSIEELKKEDKDKERFYVTPYLYYDSFKLKKWKEENPNSVAVGHMPIPG